MDSKIKTNLYLEDVAIIVRYCWIEKPYWNAFIIHHYSLGVRFFNVIVQYQKDKDTLEEFNYPKDTKIKINIISDNLTPNNALKNFDLKKILKTSKYYLLIDADEFVFSFNNGIDLSKLLINRRNLDLRWVMNPITNNNLNAGFYGGETKPLACSKKIKGIRSCHNFEYKTLSKLKNSFLNQCSIEGTQFGLILIHNWSRSLIDCLLKSSFSKTPNEKTIDQKNIQKNIKKGILNSRARYLAFLDIQTRYVVGLEANYSKLFDCDIERELIMTKYSENDLILYIELYEELKQKFLSKKNFLEFYPPYKENIVQQMKRINNNTIYF